MKGTDDRGLYASTRKDPNLELNGSREKRCAWGRGRVGVGVGGIPLNKTESVDRAQLKQKNKKL